MRRGSVRRFQSSRTLAPTRQFARVAVAVLVLMSVATLVETSPATAGAAPAPPPDLPGASLWQHVDAPAALTHDGHARSIDVADPHTSTLDRDGMLGALAAAPMEFTDAARTAPLVLSLPTPQGGFARFAVRQSPIMEPGLAAKHPDIRTYSGSGVEDPAATVRIAMTAIGFTASVRGQSGSWFIDPMYHLDQSLYVSYFGHDLKNTHGSYSEQADAAFDEAQPWMDSVGVTPNLSAGATLRVYRLALLSDPTFATFWGAANVTAGKVILMNRADQIYEDEFSYRMDLVANDDLVNLDTIAQAFEPNGPCGSAACFTQTQLSACGGSTLSRNRIVIGQLIGAANYDIGHVALGQNGGGVAKLGVVGGDDKAEGCTGIPEPDGDFYVVDYMAHEMGHEFGMNHPFNGTQGACGFGNRNADTSYEPGSGSSIMAYAGICDTDDLQPHSDPYFTAISFQETQAYATTKLHPLTEVQTAALKHFGGGDEVQVITFGPPFDAKTASFQVTYSSQQSALIGAGGIRYNRANVQSAINAIPSLPGTVTVTDAGSGGFTVVFGGAAAGQDVSRLGLAQVSCGGCFTAVDELNHGGAFDSFTLSYGSRVTPPIVNGTNYTPDGIAAAIEAVLPAGGTVTVSGFGGSSTLDNTGFQVTFGGALAASADVKMLQVTNAAGFSGRVAETEQGGPAQYNRGFQRIPTGNTPPTSVVPAATFTIPYRTPFALTGSSVDADGDTVTYLWEQFDKGGPTGTGLVDNIKTNGPLFREFGTALDGALYDEHGYGTVPCSNGENCTTVDATRVFPDMAQILAGNTDANTGSCPDAGPAPVAPLIVDCYSEYLPTSVYTGPMHFILTARDGNGGVTESMLVTVQLAAGTGPFLVTSPNTSVTYPRGSTQTVTWDVAGTDSAPVSASTVDILLSTDGGLTFKVLASNTANDGSATVTLPAHQTSTARIEVRAVGNIFFDVSDIDFTIS